MNESHKQGFKQTVMHNVVSREKLKAYFKERLIIKQQTKSTTMCSNTSTKSLKYKKSKMFRSHPPENLD